ncbi:gliding motility-associated C-terminal domain-containing protein [Crocinitomix catalasitica]|nr:gliding motility-associated C-terminal domain-containing protein [Crocinitomix catalasitica]
MKLLLIPLLLLSLNLNAQENHPVANHPDNDTCTFYARNVITPAGDCYDCSYFRIIFSGGCKVTDYQLTIFNRWGELIFESDNPDLPWDGSYSDHGLVQDDVYFWQLKLTYEGEEERTHRGRVTVLK